MIVHGFAGIGWSEALRQLGLEDVGLELSDSACRTRVGAGHRTIRCDVSQYPTWVFKGRTDGSIWGPPCPPFGKSGKKLGLTDLPLVMEAIRDLARGRDTRARHGAGCLDPRSILTAEPMRWLYDLHPEFVLMEQVPSVLPAWELYAETLTSWGYSVDTGQVDAAWWGLGSHRPRAALIASRTREVVIPRPTHGLGLLPCTAMADVVGWGYTTRPAPTITGGGTATGGAEPIGNGSRQAMKRAMGTAAWKDRGVPHLRPTIAECAALMGFRPDLEFHGGAGQQHLAIGNAVPPPLAAVLITAVVGDRRPVQLELDLTGAAA